ncbi:MAG: MFS transporter [Velocimicrobium sp.]
MTKIAQIIIITGSFSMGLLLPITNLILLDKGATLQTLPLLLAIYSFTVLVFELPSGMLADFLGRKTIYFISCILKLIALALLLVVSNPNWFILIMFLNGLNRSFSSGSMDALFIDQAITASGTGILSKVISRMSILEGIGLASGGIAGGFLASLSSSYDTVILSCLFLNILLILLSLFGVKEAKLPRSHQKNSSFFSKIRIELNRFSFSPNIHILLISTFLTGFFLSTIETYWQPAFQAIQKNNSNHIWMFGILSFLGFIAITFGNFTIGKIMFHIKDKWWTFFYFSRTLFGFFIIAFALQKSGVGFILFYTMIYFSFGICNVIENTLLNEMIPNHLRSSFLSFYSLILQIGSLFASLFSSLLIRQIHMNGLWLVSGSLVAGYAIYITFKKASTTDGSK